MSSTRLQKLLVVSKLACDALRPLVVGLYSSMGREATNKLKADNSAFTLADGLVQHLLVNHLFHGSKFKDVVGEEDESNVNILTKPFTVDDLQVRNNPS